MCSALRFGFEIAGPMAMFMRPDTGSCPVSYPLPTGSAIKALVESVARVEGAVFVPRLVHVCRPIRYVPYVCNYGGPLRKTDQMKQGSNLQHVARVLADVCYQILGECVPYGRCDVPNPHVKLTSMLERRLGLGQSRYPPCLGWKEFAPSYFGFLRPETKPSEAASESVPGYLVSPWDLPVGGAWGPRYGHVEVIAGICDLGRLGYTNAG
ncbi:MAG: hypothetical protein KIS66_02470 [Fimbriimonadaceae bacterium]|nr:hypothetical protein [Fimbriimonadaceae bacterium]